MANLSLQATVSLIDKMTAPMRGISSQANRLSRQFGEMARESSNLVGQRRLIDSFRQQKTALNDTSEAVVKNHQRLEQLQQQMRATANPTATLVRQFESAQRESQRLNGRLSSQRQHLQQLRGRLDQAGISTNNLADHERDLARQIERTNTQLAEQRRRMQRVRQLQNQSQQMSNMRNQATGLEVGGAAATYAGARFIQPGLDLEQNMSKVQALTRLDANSAELKALEDQAKQLGSTTNFTSADVAGGQSFLAMAGFTPESIQEAMPGMLDLALAGGIELDRTADISSNILSGMKLDPSQMSSVADVLSGAFTRANLDIEMLGETMKYAAPGAAGLNISLEEVAAMAGKLGDDGLKGSMGGTALRSIMSRMAAPPKAAAKAMDQLGLATTDANGDLLPMITILEELDQKTKDMGNAERAGIFKAIAGEEAGGALKILVDQASIGELQKLTDTLRNVDGEASNLAQTMSDNTTGDFKAMTSAIDAMRTSIFDANKDGIREMIQNITTLTQRLTAFANANPQLMAVLGKVFGILAIGAVILGTVGAVMLTILGPMALLRASLVTLGLPTTLTPLTMLVNGIKMVGGAFKAVGLAMMANPVLALLGLLAILAFTIYQNWDTLGPMFANLWQGIKNGAAGLWQGLVDIWNHIKMSVVDYATQLWSNLGITFDGGIQTLIAVLLAFSPVGIFMQVFAAVWPWLSGLGAKFAEYGANMLQGLANGIMSKANAVLERIKGVASKIKSVFAGILGIHSPSRVFASFGGYMMQGLEGGVKTNSKAPLNAVRGIADKISSQDFGLGHIGMGHIDTRKSILPQQSLSSGAMGASSGSITININGAMDPYAVANEVKRVLQSQQRDANARQRSRLSDID